MAITYEPQRSTTGTANDDVSRGRHGASAEAALFYAYRMVDGVETRPCACGSPVSADPAKPTLGVVMHNRSDAHQAWRGWMDYQA